jgi:hypothetical protein
MNYDRSRGLMISLMENKSYNRNVKCVCSPMFNYFVNVLVHVRQKAEKLQ